jgi:hypothetical protein
VLKIKDQLTRLILLIVILLEKLIILHSLRKFPTFKKNEVSLSCSRVLSFLPDESSNIEYSVLFWGHV